MEKITRDAEAASRLEELRAEHHALDIRLAELDRHLSLSPSEQVERATLKKRKLATKDLIAKLSR